MSNLSDKQRIHGEAVSNFLKLSLSYRFTATLLNPDDNGEPVIRFLFSKPVQRSPEPAITVFLDLRVVSEEGPVVKYALFFEGQRYKRVITMDSRSITGTEFNEKLIDKVFLQKACVRQQHRWTVENP